MVEIERMLNNRLSIVHIIGAARAGGAEWFAVNLARETASAGQRVAVLALGAQVDAAGVAMREALQAVGAELYSGPTSAVGARSVAWCRRMLIRLKPEIVHLHTPNTEFAFFCARLLGAPPAKLVRTLHSTRLQTKIAHNLARDFNSAAYSIACGEMVADAARGVVKGAIDCIPNGIRFDWPVQSPEEKARAKSRLGLDERHTHFVCVGRLSTEKGQDVLLRAWRDIDRSAARLHLLGAGTLGDSLRSAAADDPSVLFHGVRSDVRDWLLAADWFVMPSRHEGLPIAGIEGVGTGVPCVFSDIGPLRELDPPFVLWAQPGDAASLAAALTAALTAAPHIDGAAVARIRARYAMESVARRYLTLYQSALGISEPVREGSSA